MCFVSIYCCLEAGQRVRDLCWCMTCRPRILMNGRDYPFHLLLPSYPHSLTPIHIASHQPSLTCSPLLHSPPPSFPYAISHSHFLSHFHCPTYSLAHLQCTVATLFLATILMATLSLIINLHPDDKLCVVCPCPLVGFPVHTFLNQDHCSNSERVWIHTHTHTNTHTCTHSHVHLQCWHKPSHI